MKKLQNLKGAKALNKKEQLSINGGAGGGCQTESQCYGYCNTACVPNVQWDDACDCLITCYTCFDPNQ